jgi:hypothetical protein
MVKAKYVSRDEDIRERARRTRIGFEEVVSQIRADLAHVDNMFALLEQKVAGRSSTDNETRQWIYDTFLDKIYQIHAKTKRFVARPSLGRFVDVENIETALIRLKERAGKVAHDPNPTSQFVMFQAELAEYKRCVEDTLSDARRGLHDSGWESVPDIRAIDYTVEPRKKFVTAREELEKARQAIERGEWDEVMNHIRSSMDIALKAKFGFKRILRMQQFLDDAQRFGLPVPSYDLLYHYYNMGSRRLHSGIVSPPFEAVQAVRFASDLIDALDLVQVDEQMVEDFKKKSKSAI